MSAPSIFPTITAVIDVPRRREIVLPHYIYSGVLQVTFSLPHPLSLSGGAMGTGGREVWSSGSNCLPARYDVDAQIEELS